MTEFTETALRKFCRNPKCRMKLPAPVSNEREAFCTRGCHTSFYRKRCLVCEAPMERKTEHQLICGRRKCRNALAGGQDFGCYRSVSAPISPSKSAHFIGSQPAPRPDPTPVWHVRAAGAPITANQYHCAIVGADEAIATADRVNAAHWKAARAGDRGYRKVAP